MDAAINRIITTYELMLNKSASVGEDVRAKLVAYITALFEGGQTDPERLVVFGLTYLRQLDGSNDPVKAGFTGL